MTDKYSTLTYATKKEQDSFFARHISKNKINQNTSYAIIPLHLANQDLNKFIQELQQKQEQKMSPEKRQEFLTILFWYWLGFYRYLICQDLALKSPETKKIIVSFDWDAREYLVMLYISSLLSFSQNLSEQERESIIQEVLTYESNFPFNVKLQQTTLPPQDNPDMFTAMFFYSDEDASLDLIRKHVSIYPEQTINESYKQTKERFLNFTSNFFSATKTSEEKQQALSDVFQIKNTDNED